MMMMMMMMMQLYLPCGGQTLDSVGSEERKQFTMCSDDEHFNSIDRNIFISKN